MSFTRISRKGIALLSLAVVVLSMLIVSQTQSQSKKESGVTISGNKAILKAGFEFVGKTKNQVQVRRHSANTTQPANSTGSITCHCLQPKENPREQCNRGSCDLVIQSQREAKCEACDCLDCKMAFTFQPPK